MSGAAWNPKNKTTEELFCELVIKKNEYYDLDIEDKEGWLSGRKQLIANESGANTVPEVRILCPPPNK